MGNEREEIPRFGFRRFPSPVAKSLAGSIVLSAALALYYRLCWPTFHDFVHAIDFCDIPFCDFVVFYYQMGREVFLTKAPVIGFGYSPFFAVVFGFFGMFSLDVSTTLWVVLLILCMAGLGIASLALMPTASRTRFALPFLAVFLTSFPLLHNFKWGQVGVLLALLLILTLLAGREQHWVIASLCLAIATSLKYFPALFILPFFFSRDWRMIGGFIGWSVLLFVGIPSAFFGVSSTLSFLGLVTQATISKQIAAGGPNSQYFVNVVVRWISDSGGLTVAKWVLRVFSFLVVEAMLALVYIVATRRLKKSLEWSFVLLFLCIPFFVATSWPHYLVFLPFCQLFLASEAYDRRERRPLVWKTAGGMTLVSVLLSSVFVFQVMGSWERYTGAGLLFVADALLLIASWILLLPQIRMTLHRDGPSVPVPTSV